MKLFNRICRPVICGLALAALISGDKLGGDMGAPIVFVYQDKAKGINQEVKFCCPMCKPKFLKEPDKYMKIIQDAEAKAKAKNAKN